MKFFFRKEITQQLHSNAPINLARLIQAQDVHWKNAQGMDSDFQYVVQFGRHETSDQDIMVCEPSILELSEISVKNNIDTISNYIFKSSKLSSEKRYLVIPLSDNQGNWMFGAFTLRFNKVIQGELIYYDDHISSIAREVFCNILLKLECHKELLTIQNNYEIEKFYCFDYVCQKILEYIHKQEDVDIIYADNAEMRRELIAERIATKLGCQLIKTDPMTPLTGQMDRLTINDPEVESAVKALRAVLSKHSPKLVDEFDRTGILIIDSKENNLIFSCSTAESKPERPAELKPDFIEPRNLDEQLAEAAKEKESSYPEFSEEKTERLEESFRVNYDDSSDSENEQDDRSPRIDLNKYKSNIAKGKEVYNQQPHIRISFYLHVLGLMLTRAPQVKKYYRQQKKDSLTIDQAFLKQLKDNLFNVLQKQVFNEKLNKDKFESYIWPLFLKNFRNHAKRSRSGNLNLNLDLDLILFNSLKDVINNLFPQKVADIDVMTQGLFEKVKVYLPERVLRFSGDFKVNQQQSAVDHQILSINYILDRIAKRSSKSSSSKPVTINDSVEFFDTKFNENTSFGFLSKDKSHFSRNDHIDFGGGYPSNYTLILDSWRKPEHKQPYRHSASIGKYTASKSHSQFAVDMLEVTHINDTTSYDPSDVNFLRRMYYLLQRAEGSRNPASLIINIMLLKLITDNHLNWNHVLPSNKKQQEQKLNCYTLLMISRFPRNTELNENTIHLQYFYTQDNNLNGAAASWRTNGNVSYYYLPNTKIENIIMAAGLSPQHFHQCQVWRFDNQDIIQLVINQYGCNPTFIHPMTLESAPKLSAALIGNFNAHLDPSLHYYAFQDTRECPTNGATVIASKQHSIVNKWFSHYNDGKSIETANDDEILQSFCNTANNYYFSE